VKIKQLFVQLAALCVIAALVGCACTNRQVSESSLNETTMNRDGGQFLERVVSQQVSASQPGFQKPDIDINGPVDSDERQQFDTRTGRREDFRALDITGDRQISASEFLTQTPKHSKRYHFFADTDKANNGYVSWEKELFQQPGWQLFSIRF
jgi:hypothetical protein